MAVALLAAGCNSDGGGGSPTNPSSQANIEFTTSDLVVGSGATAAAAGGAAEVRYTGWLYNPSGADSKGTQFDSGTFTFTLGTRSVIPGFEQGVVGMRVGGKRRVYIPSSLGYGSQGSGPIPPNAALVFEIDLLNLQ